VERDGPDHQTYLVSCARVAGEYLRAPETETGEKLVLPQRIVWRLGHAYLKEGTVL